MRRSIIIPVLIALVIVPLGCDLNSALEEEAFSFITSKDFYKTPSDANAAVMGVYGALHDPGLYGRDIEPMIVTTTGEVDGKGGWTEVNLNWEASYGRAETVWNAHYDGINRANAVLAYVPEIQMDETEKNRLLAESHFLRGLMYFNLVRFFGGVPLHLEPTETLADAIKPRSSAEEVYERIIEDLKTAAAGLPHKGQGDPARANSEAATALLAKVYLTMAGEPLQDLSKLAPAREELLKLVNPNDCAVGAAGHALEADFADLYWRVTKPRQPSEPAVENGPESVFEINFSQRSDVPGAAFPNNQLSVRNRLVTDWLVQKFDSTDYRLERTADETGLQIKYPMTGSINNNHDNNWPYMRFADVMLMFAEVENALSGPTDAALGCVNALRERARNADGTPRSEPAGFSLQEVRSQAEFHDIILEERMRELAIEGHLWFDLQRTGRLEQVITEQGRNYDPRIELFAIPQNQIDLTKGQLTQNPGY